MPGYIECMMHLFPKRFDRTPGQEPHNDQAEGKMIGNAPLEDGAFLLGAP